MRQRRGGRSRYRTSFRHFFLTAMHHRAKLYGTGILRMGELAQKLAIHRATTSNFADGWKSADMWLRCATHALKEQSLRRGRSKGAAMVADPPKPVGPACGCS
jgi:hypothetical protein